MNRIPIGSFVLVLGMLAFARAAAEQTKPVVVFDWHTSQKVPGVTQTIEKMRFEAVEVNNNPERVARKFLGVLGSRIAGIQEEAAGQYDINKFLTMERSMQDLIGDTTVVFEQDYKGVPVYGSDVRVHIGQEGTLKAVTSKFSPKIEISTIASISPMQAIETARKHSQQPEKLNKLSQKTPELSVYLHDDSKYHLVWILDIPGIDESNPARWKYFIDAHTGAVLSRYNDLKFQTSAIGRGKGSGGLREPLYTTQLSGDLYTLEDISTPGIRIRTFDLNYKDIELDELDLPGAMLQHTTNDWNEPTQAPAVDAHFFARAVFDYYWTVHGRNSLDGNGMDLISSIRGTYWRQPGPNGDLKKWNNAVWVGTQMIYGDGDGVSFSPLSAALDVVAHEFTHGITDHTAQLEYRNQSGALNESHSDVFGAMIDAANWEMGEDVVTPGTPGDALRSLENPPKYGDPDHMSQFLVTSADGGGVHTNSGIPNKAAYLLAMGGTHHGKSVTGLGREVTAQIYYLALTKYLSKLSDFRDARRQTLKACADLFPGDQAKVDSVKNAFSAVGIE